MIGVRPERASASLRIAFARPLFDWQNAPRKFFEALYDSLSSLVTVNLGDFNVHVSNSLNEVAARYELLGGPSSIVLTAQRLSVEFPELERGDHGLAVQIAEAAVERFHSEFPECKRSGMRLTLHEHLSVPEPGRAEVYLARYAIPSVQSAFAQYGGTHQHGTSFSTTDADGQWRAHCTVERSVALHNALFLARDILLLKVDGAEAPHTELALMWEVTKTCAHALDLEVSYE